MKQFESPEKSTLRKLGYNLSPSEFSETKELLKKYEEEGSSLLDFEDLYGSGVVNEDNQEVKKLESRFEYKNSFEEKEQKFYATILEMIVMEFSNAWLPGYLSKASQFDDFKNRTDLFLELGATNGSVIRIAIDVTSSPERFADKLDTDNKMLEKNEFQKVKYFKSELDDTKGSVELPHFVVGTDRKQIVEMARLYLALNKSTGEVHKQKMLELENSPFGVRLFMMLALEDKIFIDILKKHQPESEKLAVFEELRKILGNYEKEKTLELEKADEGRDNVYNALIRVFSSLQV